jgi:hypothetical protein
VPDWKDFTVVFCALLVVVGAGALASAAQGFTIIRGKVLEKGIATLDLGDGMSYTTPTISVLLENDDRVFRIERGTVVKYAVSEVDAQKVDVGLSVELLVSSHNHLARVIGIDGSGAL